MIDFPATLPAPEDVVGTCKVCLLPLVKGEATALGQWHLRCLHVIEIFPGSDPRKETVYRLPGTRWRPGGILRLRKAKRHGPSWKRTYTLGKQAWAERRRQT